MSEPVCQERMLLPEALSGVLDPDRERQVMDHLARCPACQTAADDIEVALVSLALLRAEQAEPLSAPAAVTTTTSTTTSTYPTASSDWSAGPPPAPADELAVRRGRRTPLVWLAGAAAAILLLVAGIGVGHQLLPPRDTVAYGPALALRPPSGAADAGATGTVAVANDKGTIDVHLKASGLPSQAWFECLWTVGGQSRSAGSFLAKNGTADVDLKVVPPAASHTWDLQVVAHSPSGSQVVLEGATTG
jgi:hypothetical protein